MELSFVLSALRRRFWVVMLFLVLGAIPGLTADPPVSDGYQSVAKLSIKESSQGNNLYVGGDPDRYLQGELGVLQSASLIAEVSENLCPLEGTKAPEIRDSEGKLIDPYAACGESPDLVSRVSEIEQKLGTDVVNITVVTNDPAISRAIAQTYVDVYMAALNNETGSSDQIDELEVDIKELNSRLDQLNNAINEIMVVWIDKAERSTRTAPVQVPQPSAVAPAETTERDIVVSDLQAAKEQLRTLEASSRLRVNTRQIQAATIPAKQLPTRGQFLLAGGLFVGAMLGVIAALAWARFSTKVLDIGTASEALGTPIVSEFAHYRSLSRNPRAAFQALPRSAVPVIDQLCVRAENKAVVDQPLAVLVAGTQRGAGATTLALAMAERFASGGSSVVLVDADVRDPRITAVFNASGDGGVPAVVANEGALEDQHGRSVFTRTMDPEVSVLGLGSNRGAATLRRDTVASVLEAARRKGQVVVLDGGPVLDLASTLQIAALADAVVLAVPLARQRTEALSDLARQLGNVRDKILPVVTSPAVRQAKGVVLGNNSPIPAIASSTNGSSVADLVPASAETVPGNDAGTMVFGTSSSGQGPSVPPGAN